MPGVNSDPVRARKLPELWRDEVDGHVIDLAWSPDSALLAAVSVAAGVALFGGGSGTQLGGLPGHAPGAGSASWSPDGRVLAAAGHDGMVRLWDPGSGDERGALEAGAW